ncbi:hypothetical protein KI688_005021 [Linnemannia hyalina]|uniref:Coiled-coil domain-containing protein 16 n=1 Tax=Linnemannia hyalina TaxID=64524 RepID=A0A9P7XJW2_9FUNG|nr:hypothetical protein KI688_005021 [Linnemannia hyalina]
MSKDVRRLFAAQKAAKAGAAAAASPSSSSPSSLSASVSKRVTHPLAKYDPKTFRLTCAICGPAVPIKSDSLWNAHLVSKAHQEAVAKLRAVKEQMQRKEAEAAEQRKLWQQQQQQQQAQAQAQGQGVKRKAAGGLVAYADDSESDSDDEETGSAAPAPATNSQSAVTSDFKRVKIDDEAPEQEDHRREQEQDIEDEEETMAGLPAGFFDAAPLQSEATQDSIPQEEEEPEPEPENMEGVLPAGFFDNPEEDARVRVEVGGATADQQQRQVDVEFKALEAELARDLERQERQDAQIRAGQAVETKHITTANSASSEHIPYEEKVELEEQELEESIMARSEEEYLLFVEMQERLDALREKKNRLLVLQKSPSVATTAAVGASSSPSGISSSTKSKPRKAKGKSILDLVREQELAKKEKERQAAAAFAKANADRGDSKMGGGDDNSNGDEDESDEDDEDIEAMMDWRARRV